MGIRQHLPLGCGEVGTGVQLDRLLEVAERRGQVLALAVELTTAMVEGAELRLQAKGLIELGKSGVVVVLVLMDLGQRPVGVELVRLETDRGLQILDGSGVVLLLQACDGAVDMKDVASLR